MMPKIQLKVEYINSATPKIEARPAWPWVKAEIYVTSATGTLDLTVQGQRLVIPNNGSFKVENPAGGTYEGSIGFGNSPGFTGDFNAVVVFHQLIPLEQ